MRSALGAHLHSGRMEGRPGDGQRSRTWGWYGPYGDWEPIREPDFNYRALARAVLLRALKDLSAPSHGADVPAWFQTDLFTGICALLRLNVAKVRVCVEDRARRALLVDALQRVEASERAAVI